MDLCQSFGISPKTGYKRVHRFQAWGWEGLKDLSRAPRQHPNRTERSVVERLIMLRKEHPTWGPKKLVAWDPNAICSHFAATSRIHFLCPSSRRLRKPFSSSRSSRHCSLAPNSRSKVPPFPGHRSPCVYRDGRRYKPGRLVTIKPGT